ncbi:MAG TPA: hypothetical protein VMU17_03630 [Elusimicrobiota bacterium]|nr:hypothetical protein [Elusimicrobiota bacterium]
MADRAADKKGKKSDKKAALFYLDPTLLKDLKIAAVERETSASAIVSEAVATWLETRGRLMAREEK